VIPTWNGLELLKRFLPSVFDAANRYTNQFGAPTEIVIVDDGSEDDSVAWLVGQGFAAEKRERTLTLAGDRPTPGLIVIRNETNRGFGETCNRGFEAASYPLVLLLNNDVEVDLNFIRPLVDSFAEESVFAAHCRVFELDSDRECGTGKLGSFARGFIRVHKSYIPRAADIDNERHREPNASSSTAPLYSMFAGGGSAMFDREKFFEIGGFEPLLSPFYWEDVELSYRGWKRGYIVVYEPRSVTRHRVSSTISKLDPRRVRRLQQRNRLIYHWIHLHEPSLILSHLLWVLLLAVTAPIRLKPWFISSCIDALGRLPEIRKRRIEERRAARRSDRDVFIIFEALERRADVIAYDEYSELESSRTFIGR
jgi:GT2 family glycosyltransferase